MFDTLTIVNYALLAPLAALITYYDARYRRIPNAFVLATLVAGLAMNATLGGWQGLLSSLGGFLAAFCLMLLLHVFGAVIGSSLVVPTFLVVLLTGGVLAVVQMIRAGAVRETLWRVAQIFVGLLPGWELPRFTVPAERAKTIPYGVAITLGSLISLAIFRA